MTWDDHSKKPFYCDIYRSWWHGCPVCWVERIVVAACVGTLLATILKGRS